MEPTATQRAFLKAGPWDKWLKFETDQRRGIPVPPPQKSHAGDAPLIDLVAPEDFTVGQMPLIEAIRRRRSHRTFTPEPLTLQELSFLLWATQGVSRAIEGGGRIVRTLRTVPSGGARHPFETYLLVNRVERLEPGLYRYLPMEHKLCLLSAAADLADRVHAASRDQFVKESAVTFIWTAIPYRTEWRYSMLSPKIIAQDSGHLCQNLYLASEAIGAGTCAIGAYDQAKIDPILGVDGEEEFTIYMAPVGRVKE
jgi:SagB-type dehydrogenase family enzyme